MDPLALWAFPHLKTKESRMWPCPETGTAFRFNILLWTFLQERVLGSHDVDVLSDLY